MFNLGRTESAGHDEIITDLIQHFPLPMFFKGKGKNDYVTNKTFDHLTGEHRLKTLRYLCSLNTTHTKKFELRLTDELGKSRDVIVYLSEIDESSGEKLGIIFDVSDQKKAKEAINRLKERYELATTGSNEGLWDLDIANGEVFYSQNFKKIVGWGMKPVQPKLESWLQSMFPEDKKRFVKALEAHIRGETPSFEIEHRIQTNHTLKWISARGKVTRNKEGKPLRVVGFISDITKMKEAQLALKESEEQFQLFMKNLPVGAFIKDQEGNFIFANRYLCEFFGVKALTGHNMKEIYTPEQYDAVLQKDKEVFLTGSSVSEEEMTNHLGEKRFFQVYRFIIHKDNRNFIGGIYSDITEQKKTQTKLNILAHYDLLTNLPNRALFLDSLKHSLSKARRNKSKIALMFIDLDNFKTINDTLGHDYGDILLQEVAKRLKSVLRAEDTISRLGGDEFTVILDDIKDNAYPSVVAQKIIDTLSQPIPLKDEVGYIGASVGIAIFPDDAKDLESLIKNADMAMYRAKEGGKNIYRYFTPDMNADAKERLELSNDLRSAVANNELRLYYQPIVDIRDNTLTAFEALVRWEHPKYGLISPAHFIKLAEEGGFMAKVGKWIIQKACRQINTMQEYDFHAKIAVNISSKQLTQNHLEQTLKTIVKESGVNPKYLELEVTESFLMENIDQVEKVLSNLRKIGIQTAIDDFGTGYSSLGRLKKLPISKLKIDKSFVDDIPKDKSDMQIASTIITLGRQLGLEIVAEGVETEAQAEFLAKQGCYLMQGYLFSKAIPEEEINSFIRTYAQ